MGTFHNGFENVKVTLIDCVGNDLAKKVYEFGRISHDFNEVLPETYNENDENCTKLIDKIIEGTTLPKFALTGTRLTFRIENISRICLAQITRDKAIFASAGGGVYPLTEDFNIPMSIYKDKSIMEKLEKAQWWLEEAYIEACEKEIPNLEARYIGLHCQTISLTASYEIADFVRSCHSRTSSNFCDECNYVYRLMYRELVTKILSDVKDSNSIKLWNWLIPEHRCIYDGIYKRERLFNSDFTDLAGHYKPPKNAINDWRKSGWKMELERMKDLGTGYLTISEDYTIKDWQYMEQMGKELHTTYDTNSSDAAKNAVKKMPYYKEHRDGRNEL